MAGRMVSAEGCWWLIKEVFRSLASAGFVVPGHLSARQEASPPALPPRLSSWGWLSVSFPLF